MKESTIKKLNEMAETLKCETDDELNSFDEVKIVLIPVVVSYRKGKVCGVSDGNTKEIIKLENNKCKGEPMTVFEDGYGDDGLPVYR